MKEIMLIIHFLGLVMTLGSVGSFLLIRKNSSQVNGYEYTRDLGIIKKFLKYAYIGIGVMILSGGYLMTPYWATFGAHPMIHVKMTLVVLWLLALIMSSMIARMVSVMSRFIRFPISPIPQRGSLFRILLFIR